MLAFYCRGAEGWPVRQIYQILVREVDDLRRACVARELVNRIQNRRKDQDFAISDRITIELYSESEVLKLAVTENENYIKGETQANAIIWKDSTAGLQESDADGEKVIVEAVR